MSSLGNMVSWFLSITWFAADFEITFLLFGRSIAATDLGKPQAMRQALR